ncbi:MAG: hypothetical protein KME29_27325 [Calothrix sp. FI2-JRJ7]|jgi:glycosyltransferase involved in cell wall biosynthesis|nr:hypothetical protein [Calothrix sp. FI2-JRJ7]
MKIIQIVPHPPTDIGGISTYSLKLAEELFKDYGVFTHFLIPFPIYKNFQIPSAINGFPINILSQKKLKVFLSLIPKNTDTIIVHYSQPEGGGFSNQYWLMKVLQSFVKLHHLKLVVIFHELSLTFSLKNKIKFFYPHRFFAARGIAKIANNVITPSVRYQAILSKWLKCSIVCVPVFSNIGEPKHVPDLVKRERRMIVFGAEYSRCRVYNKYLQELLLSCEILEIEEICDIGSSSQLELPQLAGIRVVKMGEQPAEVVSQLMLTSLAGFFDYSHCPEDIGKSGIFAAYCSHGLIPVSSQYNLIETTGLKINKHYAVADEQLNNLTPMQLQSIADNARQWYANHRGAEHVKILASYLLDEVDVAKAIIS